MTYIEFHESHMTGDFCVVGCYLSAGDRKWESRETYTIHQLLRADDPEELVAWLRERALSKLCDAILHHYGHFARGQGYSSI